jgi:proteasome assembly chaperone (PAC2) family protein
MSLFDQGGAGGFVLSAGFRLDFEFVVRCLQAAASMNVSVGYFCDPDGLEGLAHFLGERFL